MTYADDDDLLLIRPDILSMGTPNWDDQHEEAAAIIDRALDLSWYRAAATERLYGQTYANASVLRGFEWKAYPFNPLLLLNAAGQLKRLSCYKALELAYGCLAKGTEDSFEKLRDYYAGQYAAELQAVLAAGLDYDWDASGAIDATETTEPQQPRRLVRC